MFWEQMTLNEYAEFQQASGVKVGKVADNWWMEIRPFFYRPLFPFTEIHPDSKYPAKSIIGGIQHVVPPETITNSQMNFFVFDDLQNYTLQVLGEKHRNTTRKGLKNFSAKRIIDVKEFVNDAYNLYLKFYNRTKYSYKEERLNKNYFRSWAELLFEYPKVVVVGAYHEEKLAAVNISYCVEDVIIDATFFSDSESQKLKVSDFMTHTTREAAVSSKAKYIFRGMPTGNQTLDESKFMRGCKLLKLPAYYKMNPIAFLAAKTFMKNSFNKLIGSFQISGEPAH